MKITVYRGALEDEIYFIKGLNKYVRAKLWKRIYINNSYIPVDSKDRKFVGQNWNQRYLRGIQCILNATHGVVSPKRKFFEAAFGENIDGFKRLLLMPDRYIIYREDHKNNGASDWAMLYDSLSAIQQEEFHNIIFKNKFDIEFVTDHLKVKSLLSHYKHLL